MDAPNGGRPRWPTWPDRAAIARSGAGRTASSGSPRGRDRRGSAPTSLAAPSALASQPPTRHGAATRPARRAAPKKELDIPDRTRILEGPAEESTTASLVRGWIFDNMGERESAERPIPGPLEAAKAPRGSRESRRCRGQATKGIRWMSWRPEAMKDVVSCDKLRGAATCFDPEISEWGNPLAVMREYPHLNK